MFNTNFETKEWYSVTLYKKGVPVSEAVQTI